MNFASREDGIDFSDALPVLSGSLLDAIVARVVPHGLHDVRGWLRSDGCGV